MSAVKQSLGHPCDENDSEPLLRESKRLKFITPHHLLLFSKLLTFVSIVSESHVDDTRVVPRTSSLSATAIQVPLFEDADDGDYIPSDPQ